MRSQHALAMAVLAKTTQPAARCSDRPAFIARRPPCHPVGRDPTRRRRCQRLKAMKDQIASTIPNGQAPCKNP